MDRVEPAVARVFVPRRVMLLIALLLVVLVALFGFERASTGASTSRLSFLPLSAHAHPHHTGVHKGGHKPPPPPPPPPPPCNRAPKNKHCRPPSGT